MRDCRLINTTRSFEYCSDIDADVTTRIDSVVNPISGVIRAAAFGGGYDVRLLRRCEPFAHGCYDQIGLALEGRSLRCGL